MSTKRHLLTPDQERLVVAAANQAPCLVGERAWHAVVRPERVDIYTARNANTRREDPHRRSTIVSCGAAAFNAGLAICGIGRSATVRVLPWHANSPVVTAVSIGPRRPPSPHERKLCEAMAGGGGYETRVHDLATYWSEAMAGLEVVAREERAQLTFLDDIDAMKLDDVLYDAARQVGLVDFDGFEEPVQDQDTRLAVLSSAEDTWAAWVWAGIAWQRILLTATLRGLFASSVSTLLDIGETRWHVRDVMDDTTWPQVILRLTTHSPAHLRHRPDGRGATKPRRAKEAATCDTVRLSRTS